MTSNKPGEPIEKILIVDFGSQVTQLIARRLRHHRFYAEIIPYQLLATHLLADMTYIKGIIFSGGPASVLDDGVPMVEKKLLDQIISAKRPLLGICYGQQLLSHLLGGKVEKGQSREFGLARLDRLDPHPLFSDYGGSHQVWMSHGDHVSTLPAGFTILAGSTGAPCAAMADDKRQIYGLQFHPEVSHSDQGDMILKNFAKHICGMDENWQMADMLPTMLADIKKTVGRQRVLAALSGGVDSSVAAILTARALSDETNQQLTCIFVDHGLLRAGEAAQVASAFAPYPHLDFRAVDASQLFLDALKGVTDPEQKRKIIGKLFIDVFDGEAKKITSKGGDAPTFLLQGTLYPDVIESISVSGAPSSTIKSHHNVGGLPEKMNLTLLEPLRALFKDEVRALGRALGLSPALINRHPFPGPGLAIRIIGAVTRDGCDLLRKADAIYLEEIRNFGLYDKIWQAFAVLLPIRTVGVMGDERSYDQVIALRAITSQDGMTADVFYFPEAFLKKVTTRLVNEVKGISRVVIDLTSKPPATIEWE